MHYIQYNRRMMDVFYIEFWKNVDTKSESDSKNVRMNRIVEAPSGKPEVIMQPIKEVNEEVSKTEDVTTASNDSTDKLETDELVTKASESVAQVGLKQPEKNSEKDEVKPEVKPEVVVPEVSVPVVSASVPVQEVETVFHPPADPPRKK